MHVSIYKWCIYLVFTIKFSFFTSKLILTPKALIIMHGTDVHNEQELKKIKAYARKNYNTYLAFYRLKNLTPMTFNEFYKNYTS